MTLAKKKKEAARQRRDQLKQREKLVQARLRSAAAAEPVEYVLPEDEAEVDVAPLSSTVASGPGNAGLDAEDTDRVQLPSVTVNEAAKTATRGSRRRHKVPWESLKLLIAERYGLEVSALTTEHDGNAEDPYFTVLLKSVRRSVPVPQHWSQLRAFLGNQADRERATDIVPPEIAALGVERIRATRDKKANPDQVSFVTCFISGTPLRRKQFHVNLSRFGDIFYEGKWLPKTHHEPGHLSQRLRAALGMGPHSPPPWLYGMQAMRRLPPAYPTLKVPGLNAPIPPGAQWGNGEGQWGQPPRNENNTFLFPGVMEEVAAEEAPSVYWGTVPPLLTSETALLHGGVASPPPPTTTVAAPKPVVTAKPTITPVPFHSQAYTPAAAARYVASAPQEYVRVQDNTAGATVALGSILVPKAAAAATVVPPAAPSQEQPEKRPQPPRRPTKF
ncbi:putative spliceosome-associated protein [Trypanosoma rangeli]|uniref:Putative spliceosome-associated protein n=1 Tax=Trypanosoma rangeli TaxID=5698 RepID=A0A3R7MML5_TRYRA|nr:putative spliceosome-associated protein [Trypanosoma rangeli]RNF05262.1 putative spliceosome-associated protein [Trypanosoma rangeli]|eukprot:RNF05262.1 putative spliceosome-associated protein [Trypanosoma rangeli]